MWSRLFNYRTCKSRTHRKLVIFLFCCAAYLCAEIQTRFAQTVYFCAGYARKTAKILRNVCLWVRDFCTSHHTHLLALEERVNFCDDALRLHRLQKIPLRLERHHLHHALPVVLARKEDHGHIRKFCLCANHL